MSKKRSVVAMANLEHDEQTGNFAFVGEHTLRQPTMQLWLELIDTGVIDRVAERNAKRKRSFEHTAIGMVIATLLRHSLLCRNKRIARQ